VIGQGVALTKAILPAKLLLHNAYCNIAQRANWNSLIPLSTATILDLDTLVKYGLSEDKILPEEKKKLGRYLKLFAEC